MITAQVCHWSVSHSAVTLERVVVTRSGGDTERCGHTQISDHRVPPIDGNKCILGVVRQFG